MSRQILVGLVVSAVLAAGCSSGSADSDPGAAEVVSTADVDSPTESGSSDPGDAPGFVLAVLAAVAAVEDELGGPQQFFEITSNSQFTNVFVAVNDATSAVAYAYIDGELQPPAPPQEGASGNTFSADDIDFVPSTVLAGATQDLPESQIDAISVYGNGVGATYVLAATSPVGGFLDIVVGPDGQVFSVDPV